MKQSINIHLLFQLSSENIKLLCDSIKFSVNLDDIKKNKEYYLVHNDTIDDYSYICDYFTIGNAIKYLYHHRMLRDIEAPAFFLDEKIWTVHTMNPSPLPKNPPSFQSKELIQSLWEAIQFYLQEYPSYVTQKTPLS